MKRKWLCGLLLLSGCDSATPLLPRELCEEIQKSHCARLYQCATTPDAQALLKVLFVDQDDCVQQGINMQKPVCSLWTEDNVCGSFGGSVWNGAAARTCLNDLDAQSCVKVVSGVLPGSCTPGDYCL